MPCQPCHVPSPLVDAEVAGRGRAHAAQGDITCGDGPRKMTISMVTFAYYQSSSYSKRIGSKGRTHAVEGLTTCSHRPVGKTTSPFGSYYHNFFAPEITVISISTVATMPLDIRVLQSPAKLHFCKGTRSHNAIPPFLRKRVRTFPCHCSHVSGEGSSAPGCEGGRRVSASRWLSADSEAATPADPGGDWTSRKHSASLQEINLLPISRENAMDEVPLANAVRRDAGVKYFRQAKSYMGTWSTLHIVY